ncbi:MAG: hypothetical protein FJX42_08860, partial [Alphaproteobacteria bacterium]|nr:hypothetical protein [Alphaproteobacteria bacterium]
MTDIRLKPPKGLKIPTPAAWRGSGGPISLWLVLTGLAMAAVGLAGLWWFWNAYIADKPLPAKPASPSHVEFRPPSYFVTTPAKPILPDNGAVKDATREKPQAYEEALAHDIRQTYVRPKPEPAAA